MWSQHPDVCYFSKGPGVAATIWLSTHLFGLTEFGVRFFSPLLALGTSLLMYGFARRLYGMSVAFWTVLTLNLIPIYSVGAVLMTIDPLSLFFWMAAMVTCWRALEAGPGANRWWPATGALIGLGFLCKWTNALQLVSILLLLLTTRRHRRQFRQGGFWTMLAVFVLFTIPPVVWNLQHDWITLQHLAARGGFEKPSRFNPGEFVKFLGEQFLVYSPVIFGGMLWTLWQGGGLARQHFKPRFLLAFALPVLALYFTIALRHAGEPNWTAPATLSLGLLTVALWHGFAAERKWARGLAVGGLALAGLMSLLMLDSDSARALGLPAAYDNDPGSRLRGWKSSAELAENYRRDFEQKLGHPVFLIANRYQTAAELAFYFQEPRPFAPGHPPVYIPESQAMENQFSFWPRYDEIEDLPDVARDALPHATPALQQELTNALAELPKADKVHPSRLADARRHLVQILQKIRPELPLDESFVEEQGVSIFAGGDALYFTDRAEERPPSTIKGGFERVEMVACIDLQRRHLPLRQWRIFACYNYHGMSL